MSKQPSPKADALRAMREAEFSKAKPPRAPVVDVRKAIERIPAKKVKRKGRR